MSGADPKGVTRGVGDCGPAGPASGAAVDGDVPGTGDGVLNGTAWGAVPDGVTVGACEEGDGVASSAAEGVVAGAGRLCASGGLPGGIVPGICRFISGSGLGGVPPGICGLGLPGVTLGRDIGGASGLGMSGCLTSGMVPGGRMAGGGV